IGAIRDRDRQRFLVKSFDMAADEVTQQPAQGPLLGLVPLKVASFCWKIWEVRKPWCCCKSHACKSFMSASPNHRRSYGLIRSARASLHSEFCIPTPPV